MTRGLYSDAQTSRSRSPEFVVAPHVHVATVHPGERCFGRVLQRRRRAHGDERRMVVRPRAEFSVRSHYVREHIVRDRRRFYALLDGIGCRSERCGIVDVGALDGALDLIPEAGLIEEASVGARRHDEARWYGQPRLGHLTKIGALPPGDGGVAFLQRLKPADVLAHVRSLHRGVRARDDARFGHRQRSSPWPR